MNHIIKRYSSVGDIVEVIHPQAEGNVIGKIMRVETEDIIHLHIFKKAGEVNRHLQVPRLNTHDYPLIAQSSMQELFETVEALQINRSNIIDFVFVLPLQLIVDGKYRCIGISNAYFIRFQILTDGNSLLPTSVIDCTTSEVILPLSRRIFNSLQDLSALLAKLMWHNPHRASTKKSQRIHFSNECFSYIEHRVLRHNDQDVIEHGVFNRKCREVVYGEDLSMASVQRSKRIRFLRFLTAASLSELRCVIGATTGVGLSQMKPSKTRPLVYCRIGCVLTSVEGDDGGIEMYFNETNNTLIVKVRFRKVVCNVSGDVTSRVQHVMARSSIAAMVEVGSWFYYQNELMEVIHILEQRKVVLCAYVEKEGDEVEIMLGEVAELVARFGSD